MDYYYIYSSKTNLVNSIFLVLLKQIVKENLKQLIIHIVSHYISFSYFLNRVSNFQHQFKRKTYRKTFRAYFSNMICSSIKRCHFRLLTVMYRQLNRSIVPGNWIIYWIKTTLRMMMERMINRIKMVLIMIYFNSRKPSTTWKSCSSRRNSMQSPLRKRKKMKKTCLPISTKTQTMNYNKRHPMRRKWHSILISQQHLRRSQYQRKSK